MSAIRSTTSSTDSPVVSSSTAPGASASGECSRLASCASRSAWSRWTVSTSPPSSSARRRARSSGSAVRKTLTGASGATTVPMSRPSATQSPFASSSRCLRASAARTRGLVATREAASLTSGARIASVTSSPSTRTRSSSSSASRSACSEAAPPWRSVISADGAVHGARVEVAEAERPRQRARHGALAGPGGPVDGNDHQRERLVPVAEALRR